MHDVKYIRKFFTLRSFEVGCMRCYVFGKFRLKNSMSFTKDSRRLVIIIKDSHRVEMQGN